MGELCIASILEGVELRQQRAFGAELRGLCAGSSSRVGRETRPPERLLENVGDLRVEQLSATEAPDATHVKYRVLK